MRQYIDMRNFTLLIFLFGYIYLFAQNDKRPQDYVVILSKDGKAMNEVIYKPDLSHEPDSIDPLVFDDVLRFYTLNEDSAIVSAKLIGKWTFIESKRTNGMNSRMTGSDIYEFMSNGRYVLIDDNDTLTGKWSLPKDRNGDIVLHYDKPYCMVKDEAILKQMSEEMIKSITVSSTYITINDIFDDQMKILTSTKIEHEDFNSFKRIVFLIYNRID